MQAPTDVANVRDQDAWPRPGREASAWLIYLVAGLCGVAVYYAVADGHEPWRRIAPVALYCSINLSAAGALFLAPRRHLASRRGPWLLLAGSQIVYVCADTTFYIRHDVLGLAEFPSIADVLYALHYPLLLAALFQLVRRRSAHRDLAGVLDAAIITVAVALVSWVFVVAPSLAPGMDGVVRLAILYQPLLDIAVLALTLRLSMDGGRKGASLTMLVTGMALALATDSLFGFEQVTGTYRTGNVLDAGWLTSYLLLGACALHPSMTRLSQPTIPPRRPGTGVRLGLMAVAALTAPATIVLQDRLTGRVDVLVDAAACAILILLVIARLAGLLSSARTAAVTDELTGLANRVLFLEQLRAGMAQARRQGGRVAVLFLDVDRFKMVNDALGHAAGDRLLIETAERLRACLRAGDVAARHGGDEFTLMLTGLASADDGWQAAERIRLALGSPMWVGEQRIDPSVSIGVAVDVAEDGPEDLLRHADAALYRAKDAGRNRVETFDQTSRESIKRRITEEVQLRDALEDGQIVAYFQPVVDMRSGRIVGGEALARWIHPEHGVIMPGRFLPLAVEVGLISMLSRRIAVQTMDLRRAIEADVPESFRLAFNLGVGEFTLLQIIDRVMSTVSDRDSIPHGLALEIMETAVIRNPDAAGRALARARERGFAISLDDFGTGYSSLSLLRDLPLDVIKIDRSFVQRMAISRTDSTIVEGVVRLATDLGLGVIAEGVETDQEVDHLLRLGTVHAQGFRYAPAVPESEFVGWLRAGPPWLRDGHPASDATIP